MLVCNKFVFLHLHKSGGTYVNQMMTRCIPYSRGIGYHLPYTELPDGFRRLPVLGTVRNPWSYYVSWYHFQSEEERPNDLYQCVSEKNTLDFEGTVTNLVNLSADKDKVEELANLFPETFSDHGLNLTRECIAQISDSGLGFYSFLYNRLYDGADSPIILKMEALGDGLRSFVDQNEVEPRARILDFLENAPRLNTSRHSDYRQYYSPGLRDLVAEMESSIIGKHEYTFESPGC